MIRINDGVSDSDVSTPNASYRSMAQDWALVHDLMGGTRAMREAGERWFPKEPKESDGAYRIRLDRSVLFNGFGRAVQTLVGKPFQRPVTLSDTAHPSIRRLAGNIDRAGRDLTVFARDLLRTALVEGVAHVLVDYPSVDAAEEREPDPDRHRPYLVLVPASNLIGWRTEDDGDDGLSRIRIQETVVEQDGTWGERTVTQIRVIYRDRFEIWRKRDAAAGWTVWRSGPMARQGVPLATLHAARSGPMTGRPPLMDLAWLNLAHWQSASDQRHILHVARVPILFALNLRPGENGLDIGPNRLIVGDGDGADIKFVEHSGSAIEAGRQDLADLEDRMAVMGLDLIARRPGSATATARAIDAAQADSALVAVTRALEATLTQALRLCAEWLDLPPDAAGHVNVHQDFGIDARSMDELDLLLRARMAGDINRSTFLREVQRRGLLGEASMEDPANL